MMVGADTSGAVNVAQQIFREGGVGGFFRCVLMLRAFGGRDSALWGRAVWG